MRPGVLLIAGFLGLASRAADAEWLLAAAKTRPVAGESFTVSVVRDEEEGDAEPMPEQLEAVLEAADRRVALVLKAQPGGRSAYRRDYTFKWPAEFTGTGVLHLVDRESTHLLLAAATPLPIDVGEALAQADEAKGVTPPPREPALGFHEPMYFLLGANGGANARFQLSFRYRLFDAQGTVVDLLPVTEGLHFAYTQTSLWDLSNDSKPFRDTSYRPSLFYQWQLPLGQGERDRLSLQAGYEHESNGRDRTSSRSIDTLFARAEWRMWLDDGHTQFGIAPKVWTYLNRDENPDIARYRGYGELGLRFGRDDGWLGTLKLRRAEGGLGSTQVDLSYPLGRPILSDVGAFLHFQYFDGFGETLLDYDESRHPQFRIGFSIVR